MNTPSNYIDDVALRICELAEDREPLDEEWPLYRMYAVLALIGPHVVSRSAIHDCWSAWTLQKYPSHPSIRPFHELRKDVQWLDETYRVAVELVAHELHHDELMTNTLSYLQEVKDGKWG